MIKSRLTRTFRLALATVFLVAMVAVVAPAGAVPTTYHVDSVSGNVRRVC